MMGGRDDRAADLLADRDEDYWVCPVCRGTRTIQPEPYTPPEPCPRCVDPDEGA